MKNNFIEIYIKYFLRKIHAPKGHIPKLVVISIRSFPPFCLSVFSEFSFDVYLLLLK